MPPQEHSWPFASFSLSGGGDSSPSFAGGALSQGGNLHMLRYGDVPLFWVLFWGCFQIFGYLFGLFPDFWV